MCIGFIGERAFVGEQPSEVLLVGPTAYHTSARFSCVLTRPAPCPYDKVGPNRLMKEASWATRGPTTWICSHSLPTDAAMDVDCAAGVLLVAAAFKPLFSASSSSVSRSSISAPASGAA